MAGTALVVGVLGVSASLALGLAGVGAASATGQRAASAADAAALAAADVASGAVVMPEEDSPCVLAQGVAEGAGADLTVCEVDGLIATVSVRVPFGALAARASARAGPPDAR
jgi:F0F1-type ATP synthase membrane subunit c/vacuolar-type H+-ATPase subunit K